MEVSIYITVLSSLIAILVAIAALIPEICLACHYWLAAEPLHRAM
ncbi:MAG: hypothetical protein PVH65_03165 [Chloroflexota bacterium]|jgi:hypothetical protein